MNEDKQIEEMRNDLIEAEREFSEFCRGRHCRECEYYFTRTECKNQILAEKLASKGYRKSSEVAEDILGEIENSLMYDGKYIGHISQKNFERLKKKYTEEIL